MNRRTFLVRGMTRYCDTHRSRCRTSALSARVEYVRRVRDCNLRAIADFFSDGEEHFADQEPGESTWFPFTPTPEERAFAASMRQMSAV